MSERSDLADVHAHFLTETYIAAARGAGHHHPDGMPGWPTWSAPDHLALMDQGGVSRSVLSISPPGIHFGDDSAARELARSVNGAGARIAAAYPDRFGHRTLLSDGGSDADPPVPEQVGRLWFDMAGTPFPRQVPTMTAAFGTERLLYGSDYCWAPAQGATAQMSAIDAADQPPGDIWRALTTRNAHRLFAAGDTSAVDVGARLCPSGLVTGTP